MNRIFKAINLKYVILAIILFSSEQSYCQKPQVTPDVQFLYSKVGGFDVYREGQRIGIEFLILFSGESKVYGIYYKSESVLERTGHLTNDQIDTLKYYFKETNFFDFPSFLPRTNEIKGPSPSCSIGYRENETDSMKVVHAILYQEKRYYPKGFFTLQSKIESILYGTKEEK